MFWLNNSYRRLKKGTQKQLLSILNKHWQKLNKENFKSLTPSHHNLISYLESLFEIFEEVIVLINSSHYDEIEPDILSCLLDEIQTRTQVSLYSLRLIREGSVPQKEDLNGKRKSLLRRNCYFCSSPIFFSPKARKLINQEGRPVHVLGCKLCNNKMSDYQKAPVLSFVDHGKLIHWSQFKDYIPSIKFWNLYKETH